MIRRIAFAALLALTSAFGAYAQEVDYKIGPKDLLEIRVFERLHPSKIRLVHELGTRNFFDRRRPWR